MSFVHHGRSRRSFLKLMASAGTVAGFGRSLWPQVAEAQTAPPLRFCGIFTLHGRLNETWLPQGGETDFNITYPTSVLKALEPLRQKIIILEGVDHNELYEYGTAGHEGGRVSFLTGSKVEVSSGEQLPRSESLDQFLAAKIGSATQFRSLNLLTFEPTGSQHVYNSISFNTQGQRVPWERNPKALFTRIFAGLAGGMPSQAELRALERRKSLLDYLVKDASKLSDKLAGPEKQKLEQHLEALRDIEKRISGMNAVTMCTKPAQPTVTNANLSDPNQAPTLVKLHFDLLAQAFACDLTRVATIFLQHGLDARWLGINDNVHDDLSHRIDVSDATERAKVRGKLSQVHTWYTEQIASFCTQLNTFTEGQGTVFDNSLMLWGNELGQPSVHSNHGVPYVILGGTGGKWRTGRYVKLRPTGDPLAQSNWQGYGDKTPKAVSHTKLLVSIAQAFGQNINTFGATDYPGGLSVMV